MSTARPDTWMPWYIGDFLRDTMHLDAEKDGAYRRLIDACWLRAGLLTEDDEEFAAISKLPLKRWLAIKPAIAKLFVIGPDGWRHKRVTRELERAAKFIERQTQNGSKGGRPRKPIETHNGTQILTQTITQTKPTGLPEITTQEVKVPTGEGLGLASKGEDGEYPFDPPAGSA